MGPVLLHFPYSETFYTKPAHHVIGESCKMLFYSKIKFKF
jgi:hypothetical protein